MKTTLNLPDELYRELKVRAVREGVPVTQLVVQGLQLLMKHQNSSPKRLEFPLIAARPGVSPLTNEQVREAQHAMELEEDLQSVLPRRR